MPLTLLSLEDMHAYQNSSIEDLSTSVKYTSDNSLVNKIESEPETIVYDGPKAKVHKLAFLLGYSEIYQNFIFKWDLKVIQEGHEARIKQIRTIFSNSTNTTKLPKFLQTFHNLCIYYANLVAEIYHRNEKNIQEFVKSTPNKWYDILLRQFSEYPPSKIVHFNLVDFLSGIKHGDLIDIEEYRGSGLFMVYQDKETRDLQIPKDQMPIEDRLSLFHVLPTLGDYGHILPEPGFNLVKEFGLGFFQETEISGFQVSNLRKIKVKIEDGTHERVYFKKPVYLEASLDMELDSESMYEVQIDDLYLFGYLTENYI